LASLLGYDPQATAAQNSLTMTEIVDGVKVGEVTQAVRPTNTGVGEVATGDWIGLDSDGICSIGSSLTQAATALLEQLVEDHDEILSVIVGDEATDADVRAVTEWMSENRPGVDTEVHKGGQSHYPFFFGVE